MKWDIKKSAELYGVNRWGSEYFFIDSEGYLCVKPKKSSKKSVNLYKLIRQLKEKDTDTPLILRFPQIIEDRIKKINRSFKKSIDSYEYKGSYKTVYPIKVNQERHIIESILKYGSSSNIGLECGSKPELLIALAFCQSNKHQIICNGFKDEEYIENILLSQKIGTRILTVVDRAEELDMIINLSKKLNVLPEIGFRLKLESSGSGRWVESSGSQSKFGLTPSEIVQSIEKLKKENLLDQLKMVHFHIGSQINSIQFVKEAMREGARFFTQIYQLGAKNLEIIDVGGGLGVDYDGSGFTHSSINYTVQEYANDIISIIQDICDESKTPHPCVISESGRYLVAHSSCLIFDILGKHQPVKENFEEKKESSDSLIVKNIFEVLENLNEENVEETYNDLIGLKKDILQLFSYGNLSLSQRAKAENIFWHICYKILQIAQDKKEYEDICEKLMSQSPSVYFGNFSVFQSLPDSWALRQTFPVAPLQRLNETPEERASIVDLTCDSDGKINHFIDSETEEIRKFLTVHKLEKDKDYFLGTFLTGAYQEILGDLHNLFGDTNMLEIEIENDSYKITNQLEGDSIYTLLDYLEYHPEDLIEKMRKKSESAIENKKISNTEMKELLKKYKKSLFSYTYLKKDS